MNLSQSMKSMRYLCDQCSGKFTDKSYLKKHIQSAHKGIKIVCNQCDKIFAYKYLRTHIQSEHESVNYHCGQCDKQFTQ